MKEVPSDHDGAWLTGDEGRHAALPANAAQWPSPARLACRRRPRQSRGAMVRKGRPAGPAKEPPISSSTAATRPRATRNEPRARGRRTLSNMWSTWSWSVKPRSAPIASPPASAAAKTQGWPLRAEMEQQEHQRASHGQQSRRRKAAARQRPVAHLAQRVTGAGQCADQQHEWRRSGPGVTLARRRVRDDPRMTHPRSILHRLRVELPSSSSTAGPQKPARTF